MSTAEITAYLAGVDIAQECAAQFTTGHPVLYPPPDPLPDELVAARLRLGEQGFAYWVNRGVNDTLHR